MKHKWLFAGASIALFTSALVFATLGANNVIFKFNDTKDTASASSTFDIDYESFSDPSNHISQAIAISSSGYTFNFDFVGFEKDQQGHMYLPHNTVGWFTNTQGLRLGFDNLQVSFTFAVDETVNYLYGAYFSYYPLTLTNIMSGTGNQDLVSDVYRGTSYSREIEYRAEYRFSSSSLANSRYTLFMIEALEQDLYIDSISFSTPCEMDAVSPGAESNYNDYRSSDKSIFHKYQVDNFPFVGNGSYKFTDDYDMGSLIGLGRSNTFDASLDTYLENNGFNFVMNSNGMDMYQKLLDINHAITVGVGFDTGFHYNYYSFMFSTSTPVILSSTSWPTNAVNQAFSSDFATMLNTYPISDQDLDITYQAAYMEDAQAKQMQMQLTITSSQTHVELQNYFLHTYLANIITNNPGYSIVEDESPYYDTYYLLQSSDGTKSVCITCFDSVMQDEVFLLAIEEENIYNTYPIDELSESSGISKSKLGTYNSSVGSTYKFITSNTIRVNNANYNTIVSEVNAYLNSLVSNNGYELLEERNDYICVTNDPFDGVEIYANFYANYVEISTSERGYETYGSLEQAISANYKGEDVITAHIFPALSEGEHEYLSRNIMDRREICISNCTNSDVTNMLSGGTYDYLTDSYLFDEGDEHSELGIRARLDQYNNLVISLVTVDKDTLSRLMTSSEVNTYFQDRDYFVSIDDTGSAKAYLVEGDSIFFLSDTHYDSYITKLTSNGYSHYDFTDQYYNSSSKGLYTPQERGLYASSVNTLMISSSETAPIDFHNYAYYSSELASIDSNYGISMPSNGYRYLLVDSSRVITDHRSENDIEQDLLDSGYSKLTNNNGALFEKYSNGYYYHVTYQNYSDIYEYNFNSETGYALYQFERTLGYFSSYTTFNSSIDDVNDEIVNSLPDLSNEGDTSFIHLSSYSTTSIDIEILKSVMSEQDLKDELENNGYTQVGDNSYMLTSANYQIACMISTSSLVTRLAFNETVYNWSPNLNIGIDPFNFGYGYYDYIARLDVAGEIYSTISNDESSFTFLLKTNDIMSYASALQSLQYSVSIGFGENGGEAEYRDKMSDSTIRCTVTKVSTGIYEINYQLLKNQYNMMQSYRLTTAVVDNGLENAQLFSYSFNICYSNGWFDKDSESSCRIEMFNVKELEEQLEPNGYEYDGEHNVYTKEDSNYTYEITINGGDVIIRVTAKTPNP